MANTAVERADREGSSTAEEIGSSLLRNGRKGIGRFHSPERVVGDIRRGHPDDTKEETIQRLVKLHCSEGALQGAISGIGGLFTMIITLPLSLFAGGVIQARLAYCIALVYGHDLDSAVTENKVAACLTGVGGTSLVALGVTAPKGLSAAIKRKVIRGVGTKLIARVGGEGAARLLPVAGAAAAGAMDYAFTRSVARRAIEAFRP